MFRKPSSRVGFTLIELLVVIAIISVVVTLSMVGVQKVRQAAARAQCQNNLKQIGIAFHNYHNVYKALPPSRIDDGYATWAVLILPYLDQGNLYTQWDIRLTYYDQTRLAREGQVPLYYCPSRRPPGQLSKQGDNFTNDCMPSQNVPGALGDYAVCDGETAAEGSLNYRRVGSRGAVTVARDVTIAGGMVQKWSSNTSFALVTDGLSNTLLAGDKHVPAKDLGVSCRSPQNRNQGDGSIYNGDWPENFLRAAGPDYALAQTPEEEYGSLGNRNFGSWHLGICHFVMCDGTVKTIRVSMSQTVLAQLAQRADGQAIPVID